jgi:predicted AAA+ superfamily ATPase
MWIPRIIHNQIIAALQQRPALILTGARQTGKTSLIRRMLPNYRYVSLDLPSEAALAERDPDAFLQRYPPPLIIDEVQYAPAVFRHIKAVIDNRRTERGLFVLTGSQKFSLMQGVVESLAGRVEVAELEPLSVAELRAAGISAPIEELVFRGGYPELYENGALDAPRYYRSYITTYLERDVRALLNVSSLRDFERFLRACALRSGQLLNKADLARDVGVSPSTANQWISVLQGSNQVVLLEPWFRNGLRSLTKSPKLYFNDTGVLCALLNIETLDQLLRSPLLGAIWETFVFGEIRRAQIARSLSWSVNFYRDRTQEVDFLVDRGGRYQLLEAKWGASPDNRDAAPMAKIESQLGNALIDSRAIVARVAHPHPVADSTVAVPVDSIGSGDWC